MTTKQQIEELRSSRNQWLEISIILIGCIIWVISGIYFESYHNYAQGVNDTLSNYTCNKEVSHISCWIITQTFDVDNNILLSGNAYKINDCYDFMCNKFGECEK